jgi:2',3'-cyclic-nucleotide 2'-phosphodiesterase (5'-nucleotidase family)
MSVPRPIAFFLGLILAACTAPPPRAPAARVTAPPVHATPAPKPPIEISILGTNDLHGHVRALPFFAGFVENLRRARAKDGGAVLLLDAGDMFQGTLASNLEEGAPVVAAYNALAYTAATLGNHEFDYGPVGDAEPGPGVDTQGAIKARIQQAHFAVLSANLVDRNEKPVHWPGLRPSELIRVDGIKVGLVGVLTAETPHIVMPAYFAGLDVAPLAPAIAEQAKKLRAEGAELVVVLAHAGGDCKRFDDPHNLKSCDPGQEIFRVARKLPPHLVDVIVAGHTHKGVAHFVNGIAIVESYAMGRAFSRVDVRLDGATHRVLDVHIFPPHRICEAGTGFANCEPGSYAGAPVAADPRIASVIHPAIENARSKRDEKLGVVVDHAIWRANKRESPLGNLFADLIRRSVPGADVAITNGGSLRTDLPPGELTYGELFEAMPFGNRLAELDLTGAQLRHAIRRHLESGRHGIISVSGLRVVARCTKDGLEVELMRPNGQRVRDSDHLKLATSDYLATGGDELFDDLQLPSSKEHVDLGMTVRDAMVQRLRAKGGHLNGDDPKLYNPAHARVVLPRSRPVRCAGLAH